MNIRLTGGMAALAVVLMVAPAALAHGGFAPSDGQGYGPMTGQSKGYGHGGMMGQGQGNGHGGMMGQGKGHGGMMGQGQDYGHGGMMGQGRAHGLGCGQAGTMGMTAPLVEDLTVEGARHMMEHRVERAQNSNLKVGEIIEVDGDTITADVVTTEGSLVRRFMFDRHTGMMRPADMEE